MLGRGDALTLPLTCAIARRICVMSDHVAAENGASNHSAVFCGSR